MLSTPAARDQTVSMDTHAQIHASAPASATVPSAATAQAVSQPPLSAQSNINPASAFRSPPSAARSLDRRSASGGPGSPATPHLLRSQLAWPSDRSPRRRPKMGLIRIDARGQPVPNAAVVLLRNSCYIGRSPQQRPSLKRVPDASPQSSSQQTDMTNIGSGLALGSTLGSTSGRAVGSSRHLPLGITKENGDWISRKQLQVMNIGYGYVGLRLTANTHSPSCVSAVRYKQPSSSSAAGEPEISQRLVFSDCITTKLRTHDVIEFLNGRQEADGNIAAEAVCHRFLIVDESTNATPNIPDSPSPFPVSSSTASNPQMQQQQSSTEHLGAATETRRDEEARIVERSSDAPPPTPDTAKSAPEMPRSTKNASPTPNNNHDPLNDTMETLQESISDVAHEAPPDASKQAPKIRTMRRSIRVTKKVAAAMKRRNGSESPTRRSTRLHPSINDDATGGDNAPIAKRVKREHDAARQADDASPKQARASRRRHASVTTANTKSNSPTNTTAISSNDGKKDETEDVQKTGGVTTPQRSMSLRQRNLEAGSRVRAWYSSGTDIWAGEEKREAAGGWYFGTIIDSLDHSRSTRTRRVGDKKVSIKFDDGSTDVCSANQVEPLEYCEVQVHARKHDTITLQAEQVVGTEERAYRLGCELKPNEWHIGDLVMANYQDKGQWFRGRVVRIAIGGKQHTISWTSNVATASCKPQAMFLDVLYDDGDWECNIPLLVNSNVSCVRWLESWSHRDWMIGLHVPRWTKISHIDDKTDMVSFPSKAKAMSVEDAWQRLWSSMQRNLHKSIEWARSPGNCEIMNNDDDSSPGGTETKENDPSQRSHANEAPDVCVEHDVCDTAMQENNKDDDGNRNSDVVMNHVDGNEASANENAIQNTNGDANGDVNSHANGSVADKVNEGQLCESPKRRRSARRAAAQQVSPDPPGSRVVRYDGPADDTPLVQPQEIEGGRSSDSDIEVLRTIQYPKTQPTSLQGLRWSPPSFGVPSIGADKLAAFQEWQETNEEMMNEEPSHQKMKMRQMHATLSNTFLHALGTSEPHTGIDMFTLMLEEHSEYPQESACRDLLMILTRGTMMTEGSEHYVIDVQRIGMVRAYFRKLMKVCRHTPKRLTFYSWEHIFHQPCSSHRIKWWQYCLERLNVLVYCTDADERSGFASTASLRRLAYSVSVQGSAMEILASVLDHYLKPLEDQSQTTNTDDNGGSEDSGSDDRNADSSDDESAMDDAMESSGDDKEEKLPAHRRIPLIRDMITIHGLEAVTKLLMEAYVRAWLKFGQILLSKARVANKNVPCDVQQVLVDGSWQVVENLACAVSWMYWLTKQENGESNRRRRQRRMDTTFARCVSACWHAQKQHSADPWNSKWWRATVDEREIQLEMIVLLDRMGLGEDTLERISQQLHVQQQYNALR